VSGVSGIDESERKRKERRRGVLMVRLGVGAAGTSLSHVASWLVK
jgi:hypothetical protein